MHDQEVEHKAAFDKLMANQRVRPTVLLPLWNIAGFALGQLFACNCIMCLQVCMPVCVCVCVCVCVVCVCVCVCMHVCACMCV